MGSRTFHSAKDNLEVIARMIANTLVLRQAKRTVPGGVSQAWILEPSTLPGLAWHEVITRTIANTPVLCDKSTQADASEQ